VKNRISIRGTAAAATVAVAVTGLTALAAVDAGAWGAETPERTVTRIADLLPEASVARSAKPAGERAKEIKRKHRRQAARAARLAREKAARAARAAREAQQEQASRSRTSYSGDPRGIAASMAASQYGWAADQFSCLDSLWSRESGWDVHASNPTSGAYGIPQALPGSKMGAYGSDWADNPTTQIQWGLAYIRSSYGTPCGAWSEFQSQGWY
jgi:hypothetical protein